MRSREIEEYKKTLLISKRQKDILIGVMLGDGHLEQLHTPTLARLKIQHSIKQKSYTDWIYNEFRNWVRSKPRIREIKGFGRTHGTYEFSTYGHKLLGNFQRRFYNNKEKIVPDNLDKDVNPLVLAIWFMDDGSIKSKKHKGVFLNTHGFNIESIKKLRQMLKNSFAIHSTTKDDKKGKQIYLGGENGENFIKLIERYIIPSMRYKIPQVLRLTELPKR